MVKTALKMLLIERRKVKNLFISITATLCVCTVFMQFFCNPHLQKVTLSIDFYIFSEDFLISLLGFFVLVICISMIVYSCNYYMKIHSREIGLIKLAGFNNFQIVLYQVIQLSVIIFFSTLLCIILSVIFIPLSLYSIYNYCGIKESIFFYNFELVQLMLSVIFAIFIIILALQMGYINRNLITSLMQPYQTTAYNENKLFDIPDYIYILGYLLGLYTMYVGDEFSAGFAISSCIGAISAYGLFYYWVPHVIEEALEDLDINATNCIVLGDLALFMKQSKILIVLIMLSVILLPTFIFSSTDMKLLHIALHIASILINILLSMSIINRFNIDNLEKVKHFSNLRKIGLTKKEVRIISIKEGNCFYFILWIFTSIYIVSIFTTFCFRTTLNFKLGAVVLLEFICPYILSQIIVNVNKRRNFK